MQINTQYTQCARRALERQRNVGLIGGNFVLDDSKNGNPRIIPIHPRIRFIPPIKVCKATIQQSFRASARALGLGYIHFHDLRHSAASEMINQGVDLYTVGGVLGHKDTRSTQRYAHLATVSLAAAILKIGKKVA